MIRHLEHKDIDKGKWDNCIEGSPNGLIYGLSWYLDCLSPGWEALVEDDYRSVFPLTQRRKWGIHYLYQPPFSQQLGLFSRDGVNQGKLGGFIAIIPKKYKLAEIALNAACPALPGTKTRMRKNYILSLKDSYKTIAGRYNRNIRRNLRKARKMGYQECEVNADQLIDIFRLNRGARIQNLSSRDYLRLKELMDTAISRDCGSIESICNKQGEIAAGLFMGKWKGRDYLLFQSMSEAGRKEKAMYYLIDDYIRRHAGTGVLFDFEGSDIPGVAYFNQGFGPYREDYPFWSYNRLPWPLRLLKQR